MTQSARRGKVQAYRTVVLLTLHSKKGQINDTRGNATRELLVKALLPAAIVPRQMSRAIDLLRGAGIIATDSVNGATYNIRLERPLSDETIEALKRDEAWARACIRELPLPESPGPTPVVTFAEESKLSL